MFSGEAMEVLPGQNSPCSPVALPSIATLSFPTKRMVRWWLRVAIWAGGHSLFAMAARSLPTRRPARRRISSAYRRRPRFLPARKTLGSRSEEHTSELQSLLRILYADLGWKKKNIQHIHTT